MYMQGRGQDPGPRRLLLWCQMKLPDGKEDGAGVDLTHVPSHTCVHLEDQIEFFLPREMPNGYLGLFESLTSYVEVTHMMLRWGPFLNLPNILNSVLILGSIHKKTPTIRRNRRTI